MKVTKLSRELSASADAISRDCQSRVPVIFDDIAADE